MLYTLRFFFSSKCSLFHNANMFGSYIIHILYTGCAKIKKKFRRQRVNMKVSKTRMKLNWCLVPALSAGSCSYSLCSGRSGDRNFPSRPDRPRGSPSLLYSGYRVFPGGKTARELCWPLRAPNKLELHLRLSAVLEWEWHRAVVPNLFDSRSPF